MNRPFAVLRILALSAVLAQSCAHRVGAEDVGARPATPAPRPSAAVATVGSDARTAPVRPINDVIAEADSAVRARGGAHADHARLFLSWGAPWGHASAVTALKPALTDTTAADTLYLCFQPGRTSTTFNGFTATIEFRCAPGDTLGAFWEFDRKGANAGALGVQFGPEPAFPCPQPWTAAGVGKPNWERTATGGRLKLIFAVPYTQAGPVDSAGTYALARVLIGHQRARLSGSGQPLCIEWTESSLAFALRDDPVVRQGERFVTWNAPPQGATCEPWQGSHRPAPWVPEPKRRSSR